MKYADDIYCSWKVKRDELKTSTANLSVLPVSNVSKCLNYGMEWSRKNSIKLNLVKTKLMPISLQKTCNYESSTDVEVVDSFKFLGATRDLR